MYYVRSQLVTLCPKYSVTLAYCSLYCSSFLVVEILVYKAYIVMQEQFTGFTKMKNFQVVYTNFTYCPVTYVYVVCSSVYHVCEYFRRGDKVGVVDVLCYRDYTREGKRVNTHSLYVKGVKLPKTTSQGEQTWKQPLLVKLNLWSILLGTSIFLLCAVPN